MRKCSLFRANGRCFTQMNAYFLVMNSKRCNHVNVIQIGAKVLDCLKCARCVKLIQTKDP